MTENRQICPCGTNRAYTDCCERYHSGAATVKTAEALMRSRYCAYVMGEIDYLVQTTLPASRKGNLQGGYQATHDSIRWIGLEVVKTWLGGEKDKIGKVEFWADYEQNGHRSIHHELSRFRRSAGQWFYVDGQVEDSDK